MGVSCTSYRLFVRALALREISFPGTSVDTLREAVPFRTDRLELPASETERDKFAGEAFTLTERAGRGEVGRPGPPIRRTD
jgi:hypothetical protein